MRQRNIKNLDERIEANANYLIEDPRACRGHWREIFGNENPIYLEIGCGKGQFITAHAEREPKQQFYRLRGTGVGGAARTRKGRGAVDGESAHFH